MPLLIRLPGQRGGSVIADRVSSVDLMPTILDLVDVRADDIASQMCGVSLVPVMQGESAQREVISETDYRQYTYKRSLITPDNWKLIYTLESRTRELYDLEHDPRN